VPRLGQIGDNPFHPLMGPIVEWLDGPFDIAPPETSCDRIQSLL
jgi:hypothetical protein